MNGEAARQLSIGEAVTAGTVANETLGYFMARIQQFLIKVGKSDVSITRHMTALTNQ